MASGSALKERLMTKGKDMRKPQVPEGYEVVFTSRITLRNGKILYPWMYGLKAFRILVRRKKR